MDASYVRGTVSLVARAFARRAHNEMGILDNAVSSSKVASLVVAFRRHSCGCRLVCCAAEMENNKCSATNAVDELRCLSLGAFAKS